MRHLDEDTFYRIPVHLQIDGYTHLLPRQMTAAQYTVVVADAPDVSRFTEDEAAAREFQENVRRKFSGWADTSYYDALKRMYDHGW